MFRLGGSYRDDSYLAHFPPNIPCNCVINHQLWWMKLKFRWLWFALPVKYLDAPHTFLLSNVELSTQQVHTDVGSWLIHDYLQISSFFFSPSFLKKRTHALTLKQYWIKKVFFFFFNWVNMYTTLINIPKLNTLEQDVCLQCAFRSSFWFLQWGTATSALNLREVCLNLNRHFKREKHGYWRVNVLMWFRHTLSLLVPSRTFITAAAPQVKSRLSSPLTGSSGSRRQDPVN